MKLLYAFLLIALPSVIFAQSNYHHGYVLKNNGDTLKGFINYREWDRTPKSIEFKINKEDKQTLVFNPKTVKGFEITGMEAYISYAGMISMNKTKLDDLPYDLDTTKRQDTIFLKPVATGKYLSLYYNNDEIKTRFFVAEANKNPEELKYYQYYASEGAVAEKSIFKGQLIWYIDKFLPGNSQLLNKVGHTSYSETDLESLINKLNGENGVNNSRIVKSKTSNIRFFAGIAGMTINNRLTEGFSYFFARTNSPKIDAGLDLFINPNVQQLVLRVDLSFSYNKPQFSLPVSTAANLVYNFNQYTTSITPQLLFNVYNKDKFKIYIDAGIGFNFSSYSNNKFSGLNTSFQRPFDLESYWANFPLQAGIVLNKKMEIAFTYTGYAAFTQYSNSAVNSQSMSLGVKYLFGKN